MKTTELRNILSELKSENVFIESSAIVLSDGLVVASNLSDNVDEDNVGTISAALFSLATTEAKQLNKGVTQQVLIKCGNNYIAIFKAGDTAVLVLDFNENANLDDLIKEATKACPKIMDCL